MEKLKNVRYALQQLNKLEFTSVSTKVQNIKIELQNTQRSMRQTPVDLTFIAQEGELRMQLTKWSQIEESIYKQKSMVQWLKLGDTNTTYFLTNMKGRKA